ncbi:MULTISPECIES: response regulator [Trichocoleus]|uniref:histidine kinase n=1 Tax=Trichocoleus desertorum GB2-A4 TaxID=2933944 RepID=A0ABV0JAB9_9CYAN|nr:response regulator [Trichocoleus sp. FACHB-46]
MVRAGQAQPIQAFIQEYEQEASMKVDTTASGVILIVDDIPANLGVLFDFLADTGFQVLIAEDGESALQTAEYASPDLILLDVLMPEIDGFETCRRLKLNYATQDIPVIFMTALTETIDKVKGLNLGAVDYITKPLQHEEVLARVKLHLNLRNLTKQLQAQNLQLEQEVVERKRIEADLRHHTAELAEWKNRYEAIIQASGQILFDWNSQTHEVTYGGNLTAILGYSPEEMAGGLDRWVTLIHPEDRSRFHAEIDRVIVTKQPFHQEFQVARQDGTYITVESKGYFFADSDGQASQMAGFIVDISDRKRHEEALRETSQMLQALIQASPLAIVVLDPEGRVQVWNPAAQEIFDWSESEVLGEILPIVPAAKQGEFRAFRQRVFQGESFTGVEVSRQKRDGSFLELNLSAAPLRNAQGEVTGVIAMLLDVTAKKQLESQALRAQRMESIGTLASGIAHDLNNLLTPILSSAQLLLMPTKLPEAKKQQLLKTMEASTKRAAALVKQVLLFARGVEGKRITLQMSHLITEIRQITQETFPRWIEVEVEVDPNLWMVSGDTTQLHQALLNLCVNARDAMPNGGILKIAATNIWLDEEYAQLNIDAKVGPYVLITVTDTGTGIPPAIIDRVFEPFFTTKEVGQGTGLGLSTVVGIVKGHGGFVQVQSRVGQGTEFKLYLPIAQTYDLKPDATEYDELKAGHGEVVLVVDDEEAICEVTKTSLEYYGYKVLTAKDGVEAIAIYVRHQSEINVVLVDMMMPSMDGPTTIRTLQKINPQVKIIGVSGLISHCPMTEFANSNNVKSFLPKPYTSEELLQNLRVVLTTY